jgi:hypothetical protein
MKSLLCILIFIVPFLPNSFAQVSLYTDYEIKQAIDFYNFNKFEIEKFTVAISEPDVYGSPFLNDEFIEGSIFTTSKIKYESIPLRLNIYNDQIEFRSNDQQAYVIAFPEILGKVEFGAYTIEFIPYYAKKKIKRGFFTVLEKGNVSLYSRQKVIFESATKPAAFKNPQPAKFSRKPDEYYIRRGMEPAKQVLNKKNLVELFAGEKEKVNAFIRKNKVKTNNPESLKDLVSYYNSL